MPEQQSNERARELFEQWVEWAVKNGYLLDKRDTMPRGIHPETGEEMYWRMRVLTDILGVCIHHNGSNNTQNPRSFADYHTSPNNHIRKTSGLPCPTVCYDFAVPDLMGPAWLLSDLLEVKASQGAGDNPRTSVVENPGDENRHLASVVVMGDFDSDYHDGSHEGPTHRQMNSLEKLLCAFHTLVKFSWRGLFGHLHFGKAACPGRALMAFIERKRSLEEPFFYNSEDWQNALLKWNSACLDHYGPDGIWGRESRTALTAFQRSAGIRTTAMKDPFTALKLANLGYAVR